MLSLRRMVWAQKMVLNMEHHLRKKDQIDDDEEETNLLVISFLCDAPEVSMVVVVDSVPASLEAPQFALIPQDQEPNDNILSMFDVAFTKDDIISILVSFNEEDNSNNWRL